MPTTVINNDVTEGQYRLDTTIADTERVIGRKLSWWERLGFWWDATTTRTRPALKDYGDGPGPLPATGDVADALSQTAVGQATGQIVEGVVDTAEVTADVAKVIARPVFSLPLIVGAIALYLWLK